MEFTITRDQLLAAVQAAVGVVERRSSLPVLANLLLRVEAERLSITGSDMEIELTSHSTLTTAGVDGAVTVAGRKLLDICRSLPENATLQLTLREHKLLLQAGKSRFQLATLPASDFPLMAAETDMPSLTLREHQLFELLSKVHFAMAQQDVRYYLNGMLFEFSPLGLTTVATDGHRLALARQTAVTHSERVQWIVPRKGVGELLRLLNKTSEQAITINYGSNIVQISLPQLTLVSRLIEGRFPDYHRVIPPQGDKIVTVMRDHLRQLLQRVIVLTNEKFHAVRLNFQTNLIVVVASNLAHEEAYDELSVDYQGEAIEMGFNAHYLLDVLSVLPTGQVKIILSTPENSVLIESGAENNEGCYVIMPMSL